jgi:AraC-like DNA-binding protein/ligand-binding sensor protein
VKPAEDRELIENLSRSKIFSDYRRAFSEATGMPLALRTADGWEPALHNTPQENPFCSLMAKTSRTCAACLEVQEKIAQNPGPGPRTMTCFAGLSDTAIPLRFGHELVGFLQTGQVMLSAPTQPQFDVMSRQLIEWGYKTDLAKVEEAWFHSKVLKPEQYQATVRLLSIFAQHLSIVGNQLLVQQRNVEPPVITRAKQYIEAHQSDELSLNEVAKAVNTSSFYFCKLFKKATGLNFTDYVSRVRVEKAKNLLLNPNARVSEVAFEVGFQSLTHFNRVFRRVVGESPSEYREDLPQHS